MPIVPRIPKTIPRDEVRQFVADMHAIHKKKGTVQLYKTLQALVKSEFEETMTERAVRSCLEHHKKKDAKECLKQHTCGICKASLITKAAFDKHVQNHNDIFFNDMIYGVRSRICVHHSMEEQEEERIHPMTPDALQVDLWQMPEMPMTHVSDKVPDLDLFVDTF